MGVTARWQNLQDESEFGTYVRQAEIKGWLKQRRRSWEAWPAVDDKPLLFCPFAPHLIKSDPQMGLTADRHRHSANSWRGACRPWLSWQTNPIARVDHDTVPLPPAGTSRRGAGVGQCSVRRAGHPYREGKTGSAISLTRIETPSTLLCSCRSTLHLLCAIRVPICSAADKKTFMQSISCANDDATPRRCPTRRR
jgi:hypothetical protein